MELPLSFREQMRSLLNEADYDAFFRALQSTAPTCIRINRKKATSVIPEHSAIPWCEDGFYLTERPAFTFDPLLHAGGYYVQEASSMFVAKAIEQYVKGDVCMLDLCAAPGGKSTLLRSLLSENSFLIANEFIRNRAQVLSENLIKWGHPHTLCTSNAPADFSELPATFDAILADVPCSGEGMFRKDEGAIGEWSLSNVALCQERQRKIIADVWASLKAGGILIYSTCTYNRAENEDNVMWIVQHLGAEILPLSVSETWGVTASLTDETLPVYRFLPHKTKGEGFFMAVLRKKGERQDVSPTSPKKKGKVKGSASHPANVSYWLQDPTLYTLYIKEETTFAFPKRWEWLWQQIEQSSLYVLHAGVPLCTQKGKDLIPHHAWAMSTAQAQSVFPTAEVDYSTTIAYLRKEAIVLPDEHLPRGYVLLTYRRRPIGFVKHLGNRANNLYPAEWKIRSSHPPTEPPEVVR